MTIERITELEWFIDREMKGNEALTNDPGCVARAKIDRDILACMKELEAHREAWEKVSKGLRDKHRESYFIGVDDAIKIVDKYRPKEGDSNASAD